ncbi:Lrp/AsnC family transcriptional regulator [Geopsychrobacter electrodiphilus]|uniref:Lrp/AsnC family transcriptional regulator n=1 Tax=Geopsychrobacter electrodiphilus TaxID=225196 RepID=UPI00037B8406|nr:Lrp/AsnC family transcriptional regulator [Geopsychrobacter electrodiphilus]
MSDSRIFDDIDLKILEILQEKARIPNAEVARQVGMAPSAILERIRKLELQGVIQGYEVRLDPAHFGQGLTAFVELQTSGAVDIGQQLMAIPGAQEVFQTSGTSNYLCKLRLTSLEDLGRCLRDDFGALDGVSHVSARVVLDTLKETRKISLDL